MRNDVMLAKECRSKGITYANNGYYENSIECLERAIQLENRKAINDLAVVYQRQKNYEMALKYYKEATKYNTGISWLNLGAMYEDGFGVKKDMKKALKYYETAIKFKCYDAYFNLYQMYANGVGVKQDIDKSNKLLKLGAKKQTRSKDECYGVIMEYCYNLTNGIRCKKNSRKAYRITRKNLKKDAGGLYYNYACYYYYGDGAKQNTELAIIYFKKAVEKNYTNAYFMLARIYDELKEPVLVAYYLRRGIDEGNMKCLLLYADFCLQNKYNTLDLKFIKGYDALLYAKEELSVCNEEKYDEERKMYMKLLKKYKEVLDNSDDLKLPSQEDKKRNKASIEA